MKPLTINADAFAFENPFLSNNVCEFPYFPDGAVYATKLKEGYIREYVARQEPHFR